MPVAENVVTQQKNFSLKIWKKIWPFIRPYRAYLFGAIAMMMVTDVYKRQVTGVFCSKWNLQNFLGFAWNKGDFCGKAH